MCSVGLLGGADTRAPEDCVTFPGAQCHSGSLPSLVLYPWRAVQTSVLSGGQTSGPTWTLQALRPALRLCPCTISTPFLCVPQFLALSVLQRGYQNACPPMPEWKVSNQTKLRESRACRKPTGVGTNIYIGAADFRGKIVTTLQNEVRKFPVTLWSWRLFIASQKVMP